LRTRIGIGINRVSLRIDDKTMIVHSTKELRVLSSAVLNGGLTKTKTIINHHVPKGYRTPTPEHRLRDIIRKKGLDPNTIGLMTSADVRNVATTNGNESGSRFSVIVTAGVSNSMTAGDDPKRFREHLGTINMIIILDSNLTDACFVEVVKTATEAKTLALREINILSHASNRVATGTSTDTVTVASTSHGKPIRYAGTATPLGSAISRNVIGAVKEAIRKQDGIKPDRPLEERLRERGITADRLMRLVSRRLSVRFQSESEKRVAMRSKTLTREALQSIEIASIILASLDSCENSHGGADSRFFARGVSTGIAYLIGGDEGKLEFRGTPSNADRTPSEFVVEGIVSGVIGAALKKLS